MGATAVVQGPEPDTRHRPQTPFRKSRGRVGSFPRSSKQQPQTFWCDSLPPPVPATFLPFSFAWSSPHRRYNHSGHGPGLPFPLGPWGRFSRFQTRGGELGGALSGFAVRASKIEYGLTSQGLCELGQVNLSEPFPLYL